MNSGSIMNTARRFQTSIVELAANPSKETFVWIGLFAVALFVYLIFSSGDFSFLLTLSAITRMFGVGFLNVKVWGENSFKGVSLKTLELYALVFFLRLMSILRHEGYLPYDKSGDRVYHFLEAGSLVLVGLLVYGALKPLKASYQQNLDCFGNSYVPPEYGALWLFVPAFVLGVFLHPSMNNEFFSDTCWTVSMYLESVAMGPQLYMMIRGSGSSAGGSGGGGSVVDSKLSHTMAALTASRLFEIWFWMRSYQELVGDSSDTKYAAHLVLFSQVIQLIIMSDFIYHYVTALSSGQAMELPRYDMFAQRYDEML